MTAPRLFDDMSAHEQQSDAIDTQIQWWLEHGRTVGAMIFALFVVGVVFLLAALR